MPIKLTNSDSWHTWAGTKPTASPVVATAAVDRTATLPGDIMLTVKGTAEALADGTLGRGTVVRWTFSADPCPAPVPFDAFEASALGVSPAASAQAGAAESEARPGAFYEAFAEAVEGAMEDAIDAALKKARQSTLESHPAPSPLSPLPA